MRFILPLILLSAPAFAQEQPVVLKPGAGLEQVQASCAGCHSLDYIRMNAPFLNAEGWKAEVTKMRAAFSAPVDDQAAEAVLKYLAATYGPPGG